MRDFVFKMEHKRKCFLGHRPDRPKAVKDFKSKEAKRNDKDSKEMMSSSDLDAGSSLYPLSVTSSNVKVVAVQSAEATSSR